MDNFALLEDNFGNFKMWRDNILDAYRINRANFN